jgi:hypothetical protein
MDEVMRRAVEAGARAMANRFSPGTWIEMTTPEREMCLSDFEAGLGAALPIIGEALIDVVAEEAAFCRRRGSWGDSAVLLEQTVLPAMRARLAALEAEKDQT